MLQQVTIYRTQVKALEMDLKKKDMLIGRLTSDLRSTNSNPPLMNQPSATGMIGSALNLIPASQSTFYGNMTNSVSQKGSSKSSNTSTLK